MTTWLKGLTTWANLSADLIKLAAGEISDGAGNAVGVADRWVRETVGVDLVRSHASQDVSLGNMSNRMGYWSAWNGYSTGSDDWHGALGDFCKMTAVHTSGPSSGTIPRWVIAIAVGTANSVAGNYSTALLRFMIYNADTGASVSQGTVSPNAAGVAVISSNGLQVTVGNPVTGIINLGMWMRQFDLTYMGGVDWYGPMIYMKNGAVAFSVAPPSGSSPTDWAECDVTTSADNFNLNTWALQAIGFPRGGIGQGIGIKTNAACTGALYTYSYSCAQHKIMLENSSGGTNGQILIRYYNDFGNDGVTQKRRGGGSRTWLRPFQTPGSVLAGSAVQYWMAVGPASIAIIVNGDPLNSGKLSFNMLGLIDTQLPLYDKFPNFIGDTVKDFTADNVSYNLNVIQRYRLWDQKKRQDGSENRDWQTGWSRCDFQWSTSNIVPNGFGAAATPFSGWDAGSGNTFPILYLLGGERSSGLDYLNAIHFGVMERPNDFDGKWWVGEIYAADAHPTQFAAQNVTDSARTYRGPIKDVYWNASGGWSSGDELLDTDGGKQYFLINPDYTGFYGKFRVASNDYRGGFAVLESA